jgi:hypothetical protein
MQIGIENSLHVVRVRGVVSIYPAFAVRLRSQIVDNCYYLL